MTDSDDDTLSRIATTLRTTSAVLTAHSELITGSLSVAAFAFTVLAFYTPDALDTAAALLATGAASDTTHTLLLTLLIGMHVGSMPDTTTAARADGGDQADWRDPILAFLAGFIGVTIGSGFGDQWTIPGFFVGVVVYLLVFTDSD